MNTKSKSLKQIEEKINAGLSTGFKILGIVLIIGCMGACFGILPLDNKEEQAETVDYNPNNDPRIEEMYRKQIEEYELKRYQEEMEEDKEYGPLRP